MEVKKTKQADMTNRSNLYFLIGLNVVLLLVLLFLEFARKDTIFTPPPPAVEVVSMDEEVIITERQFDEPPPPIEVPKPPDIPVEIKVVEDDVELEDPKPVQDQNENQELQNYQPAANTKPKVTAPPNVGTKKEEPPKETVDEVLNANTATRAPIYPGCEKYKSNKELYQCFNQRFGSDILSNLDQDFEVEPGQKIKIQIVFKIDKNGNLQMDRINEGKAGKDFVRNAESAFSRVASTMERKASKGKGIQPALNAKNQPAVMNYIIPIGFTGQD